MQCCSLCVLLLLLLALCVSCSVALQQYTPEQANWTTLLSKPISAGNINHAPDGVSWITAADWNAAKWDGVTTYNPSRMTPAAFLAAICPSVDRIRGIREVFYANNPFADVKNPTKAEVDNWHRLALNHVRRLVGYGPAYDTQPDICLHARALWGDQRKYTTMWDAKYPGTIDSAAGPCTGGTNAHCGASFVPDAGDQAPYLPAGYATCGLPAGSEGVFSASKSNIPWSIKWSRSLCNTLAAEGFFGGHVGPFFHRQLFGWNFWDADPTNINSMAPTRFKWGGTLLPSMYCDPATAGCNPNDTGPGSSRDVCNATACKSLGSALIPHALLLLVLLALTALALL